MTFDGFDLNFQNEFIEARGSLMLHEIAISCTCRVEDTFAGLKEDGKKRRREPFCHRCGGQGWLYRDPQTVRGIVTNIRQNKTVLEGGIASPGDLLFGPVITDASCQGSRQISLYDKLTATWTQPLDDGQTIVRQAATTGDNLGLTTGLDDSEDLLWYEPGESIWCEDENNQIYNQDADFLLGPGRIIKWIGNSPAPSTIYTIKYRAYFEWISWLPPQERYDHDSLNLGQAVFLRKKHVALTTNRISSTPDDKIPIQTRMSC